MDFKTHIIENYGEEFYNRLATNLKDEEKNAGLLNEEKMSFDDLKNTFKNIVRHPFINNAFLYKKDEYALGKSWHHNAGVYYLQDPSAMMVAHLLDLTPNDIVLDMCAAPGGKTIQASLKMQNEGLIIANDISYSRSLILSQNVERMGRKNTIVTNVDGKDFKKYKNTFTKIILDAPCSGSGMFRKNAEMYKDWSYEKVLKCAQIQKELILLAYDLLTDGGVLSYSTCSYSPQENEEIIQYLLDNTDGEILPINIQGCESKLKGAKLFTSDEFGEGQFICQIKKPGTQKTNNFKIKNEKKYVEIIEHYSLKGQTRCINNELFLITLPLNIDKIKIIRYGLKIGSFLKEKLIPDHHLSHYLDNKKSLPLTEEEMKKYLAGETLNKANIPNGYHIVSYQGVNLGLVKSCDGLLKNHYPKGLRIR